MKYDWLVKHDKPSDILGAILQNRQISPLELEAFLSPNFDLHTFDPELFDDMQGAVARIFTALSTGESIVIHGDYDADGVSGSALLYSALRDITRALNLALNVAVFLPDREKDGYGVAMHTIERLGAEKVKLLITVDCGIANAKEFKKAHECGIDVIICDHHQLGEELPQHALIIHPLSPQGARYPNKHLCGTGVAFKLATALIREARKRGADLPDGYEKWFLDLVAIATVTDVMPILGENRVLETYGLKVLKKTRRKGIQRILQFANTQMEQLSTETIGFQIGPRLNAAGRIASAKFAFDALVSEDDKEAQGHAEVLERLNRERRSISDLAYKEAKGMVAKIDQNVVHVVASESWNPGIIGLVAGKLVTDFGLPAFAFARVGNHYVGSGRSAGGLHLVEAMRSCGDIFVKFGGHPEACGLTLASETELGLFKERVEIFAKNHFGERKPTPTLAIDARIDLAQVDWTLWHELERLQPFGAGNTMPIFTAVGKVEMAEKIGNDGKHLRLRISQNKKEVQMVGFSLGDIADTLLYGDTVEVAFTLDVNEWKGKRELQGKVVDVRRIDK